MLNSEMVCERYHSARTVEKNSMPQEGFESPQQSIDPACLPGNSFVLLHIVRRIGRICHFRNPCGSGLSLEVPRLICLAPAYISLAVHATSRTGRHPQDVWATCRSRHHFRNGTTSTGVVGNMSFRVLARNVTPYLLDTSMEADWLLILME